ncbi:MAG TPA: histidine kinase dimerization/phospho-acceptor domain-containing protein [Terriglobia bacterium]|nr:histidine kinase dimerization/phospho-acceptor domain-containing protein [Terriglobia bacterium]
MPLATELEADSNDFLEALRMLAHQLSQPLTSLCGSVEVALMGELDESECRRVLELSLQESRRIGEILEALRDVLDMEGAGKHGQAVCWTWSVRKLLEDAASVDRDGCPRFVSEAKGDVWVEARPQHLDTATARLIGGAIRAARARREVRIGLSARAGTACLSVCEEGAPPDTEAAANRFSANFFFEKPVLGGLDKWVVRRAIERQGGKLRVSQVSETCRCYELHLPLATAEMGGKKQP